MDELAAYCPRPPSWDLRWAELDARYPWIRRLAECPQDAQYHAEGNVWIHTRMVCTALAALPAFRALPEPERHLVFAAALLHDVAKPDCTRQEPDGRISSRGHSGRGERVSRRLLWELDTELATREHVARLVRIHQLPFFLIEREDAERIAYRASLSVRCDLLALVAEADARGRHCADAADQQRMLDNVELFRQLCGEHDCLDKPRQFPSAHARFEYFRKPGRHPDYPAFDDTELEVIVMCGLPASGKDTWIRQHAPALPVVSLDDLRAELGVDPADNQSHIIDVARQRARVHLRAKQPFVWNATNLVPDHRNAIIDLCTDYGARVRLVYLDAPARVLHERNRSRANPVPAGVLKRMIDRWTVPDFAEASRVDWIQTTYEATG